MARRYYDDYFNAKPSSSGQDESSNQNEHKPKKRETVRKKFIRYNEGAELYSMCKNTFIKLAAEAGAVYKVNRISLVNVEVFEEYLENFRII